MYLHALTTLFLTLLALLPSSSLSAKAPKNAILLSSVKSLTLRANAKTSHRRVSAIPQLTCKGPGCKHHTVEIMRCTNQGADYNEEDIQWSCTANVPEEVKLGSTEVICEGYSSPDDPYVLKGSCGVEYRLLLTEKGEERYGSGGSGWFSSSKPSKGYEEEGGSTIGAFLFSVLFFAVAGWIIYSIYQAWLNAPRGNLPPRRFGGGGFGGWGGGPGGGGGGPGNDPPPPYPGKPSYGSQQQQGFQPGFWTGAATGAAAGYFAGNRNNNRQAPVQPQGGGWFGNSGGNRPSSTRSSGSSTSSGVRHESTGFGSTTRR